MKINNQNIMSDISIEITANDVIKLWHELEYLSDNDLIEQESHLMKLKIIVKENIFMLNKSLNEI